MSDKIRIVYDIDNLDEIIYRLQEIKDLTKQINKLYVEQFVLLEELSGRRPASTKPGNPEDTEPK